MKRIFCDSNSAAVFWGLIHVALSLLLASEVGMLTVFQDFFFSGADQREYWHIANVLLGHETEINPHNFELRPFVFPLYLGLALGVGPYFYLAVQLLCLFLSVFLIVKTVTKLCDSWLYVALAMLGTLSSTTLLIAPYQAMTESLSVLFVCSFVYAYTCYFLEHKRFLYLILALLCLTTLVCIKGIFLPFLLLFLVYHGVRKDLIPNRKGVLIACLCFMPIIIQLGITTAVLGFPSISKAGSMNFSWRYFPGVYSTEKYNQFAHYNSDVAKEARNEIKELPDQVLFVLSHPIAWAKASWFLWKMNYERGGEWLYIPDRPVKYTPTQMVFLKMSIRVDTGVMWMHIVMLPLAVIILGFKVGGEPQRPLISMLLLFQVSIFLLSVLVYYQGDRIVLVTVPVFTVAYPTILYWIVCRFKPAVDEDDTWVRFE